MVYVSELDCTEDCSGINKNSLYFFCTDEHKEEVVCEIYLVPSNCF